MAFLGEVTKVFARNSYSTKCSICAWKSFKDGNVDELSTYFL